MQWVIIAKDFAEGGSERRKKVRQDHVALGDSMRAAGKHLYGVATLSEEGEMNGSVMIVDFENREELETWLAQEPYMTGRVWESVDVIPCKVGPSFFKK